MSDGPPEPEEDRGSTSRHERNGGDDGTRRRGAENGHRADGRDREGDDGSEHEQRTDQQLEEAHLPAVGLELALDSLPPLADVSQQDLITLALALLGRQRLRLRTVRPLRGYRGPPDGVEQWIGLRRR